MTSKQGILKRKGRNMKKNKILKKNKPLKKTKKAKKVKSLKKIKTAKKAKAPKKKVLKKAKVVKKAAASKKVIAKKVKAPKKVKIAKKAKAVKKVMPPKKVPVKKAPAPATPAIQDLQKQKVMFTLHPYQYEEPGGTKLSAMKLGVDEHIVIKTLVMEDENGKPLIILMHGDKEVATDKLAATIGAQTVSPCKPEVAQAHTGYQVGGTSPFGIQKIIPVFMERTIADLPNIYINAGQRGLLAQLSPLDLINVLKPFMVSVAR
jgi:Cys-tRNA(Pro) deacylase